MEQIEKPELLIREERTHAPYSLGMSVIEIPVYRVLMRKKERENPYRSTRRNLLNSEETERALKICDDSGCFNLEGFVGGGYDPEFAPPFPKISDMMANEPELRSSDKANITQLIYYMIGSRQTFILNFQDYVRLEKPRIICVRTFREITPAEARDGN
jgi:hypothetical protein